MSTTDPIYITPSTSVVLVNTADYSGNPIVLLPNIDSLGRIITIRDADGGSYTKSIYISTTGGALFQQELSTLTISSFRITQPYGYLTVTPRLIDGGGNTRYGLMNSFAFPEASDVAFMNIFNANVNYLSTVSTINLSVKQNAIIQGNTTIDGDVYVGGNIQFISPNTNTFLTGAVNTNTISTNVIRAASIFTSTLTTSTIEGKSIYLDQTLEASTIRVTSRPIFDLSGSASWLAGGFDMNSAVFGRPTEYAGAEIGASSNFFGIRAYTKNNFGTANFSTNVILSQGNFGINVSPTDLATTYALNVKGALRLSNDGSAGNNIIQRADNSLTGSNRHVNTFGGTQSNYTLYSASNYTEGFYNGTTEYKWITADKGSLYPEKIRFWTSNATTARMTVDSNGYVGLAYESPREQLDVSGNIRITNNYSYIGTRADGTTSNGLFNISAIDNNTYLNYGTGGSFNLRNNTNNTRLTVTDNLHIMKFGTGSGSTIFGVDNITIGNGTTTNQNAFIDLVGDTTYSDYGFRIIRQAGANGNTNMEHRGTGEFKLYTYEASPITFHTSATERMRITSGGTVGINTATPGATYKLDVNGAINLSSNVIDFARNRAIDGTNSVPTYSFYNAETTGMYRRTTGEISFTCGGTGVVITENRSVTPSANNALKLETSNGSTERMLFCTYLSGSAFNNITQTGDAGIFYGTSPSSYGLVIAPHRTGLSGIRLDSNGNVGIGGSPDSAFVFDVTGKSRVRTDFRVGPDTTNGFIRMTVDSGISYIQSSSNESSSYNKLYFTGYGGNNNTMTLDIPNQRVGIGGQTGPTEKLDVTGNIKASGTITAGGLITANAGLTVPSGQATNTGAITASGLITANAGLTVASGQTLTANGPITGASGLTITSGATSLQGTTINGNLSVTGTIAGGINFTLGVYSV